MVTSSKVHCLTLFWVIWISVVKRDVPHNCCESSSVENDNISVLLCLLKLWNVIVSPEEMTSFCNYSLFIAMIQICFIWLSSFLRQLKFRQHRTFVWSGRRGFWEARVIKTVKNVLITYLWFANAALQGLHNNIYCSSWADISSLAKKVKYYPNRKVSWGQTALIVLIEQMLHRFEENFVNWISLWIVSFIELSLL